MARGLAAPRSLENCPLDSKRIRLGAHGTFASSEVTGWASPANRAIVSDRRDWYRRRISAHAKSAISRLRRSTECRARMTTVATLVAAQNGTSGALADCKHAGRRANWATPRTIVVGYPAPSSL